MVAFSVKCGDPVAEDVHSAWNSVHFVYVWHGSVDHLYISSVSNVGTQFVTQNCGHFFGDKLGSNVLSCKFGGDNVDEIG